MTDEEKKALELEQQKLEAKMNALVDPIIQKLESFKGEKAAEAEELKKQMEGINDSYKALQKMYDELDIKLQKAATGPNQDDPVSQIKHAISEANFLKTKESAKRGGIIDLKGIDIMNTKVSVRVTDTIAPQFTPFVYGPQRRHIRDFLPVTTTTAPHIWMPYAGTETNNAARVAENAAKPESVFAAAVTKYPVEKIATFIVFSEEILDDMPGLIGYITTQWIEKLKRVEDTQLLYGTGSSQLYGLTAKATAYVDNNASAAIDRWMVLDTATTAIQAADFQPDTILMHPTTVKDLRQTRSTTYEFIRNPWEPIVINGATVIPHAAMVAGDFLVGDFAMAAQIYDRQSANVRFYDQDSTNAQYNLITAVIEERLALVTYHATALCYGNFTVALAQGSA